MDYKIVGPFLIILLVHCVSHQSLYSQSISSPKSLSMGEAGTAYLGGIESIYHNPANLQFVDSNRTIQINIGTPGMQFDPVLSQATPGNQWRHFKSYFDIYEGPSADPPNSSVRNSLDRLFPEGTATNTYSGKFELQPIAISLHKRDYSLSLSFRTRIATNFEIGRGWFSHDPIATENEQRVINRTLTQQFQTFHEVHLTFSQPLTYVNGLTPSLGRFFIGISPKYMFGGTFLDASYDVQYYKDQNGNSYQLQSFYHHSSGAFSQVAQDISRNLPVLPAVNQHLDRSALKKSAGYGLGVDFGLTYVHPLNSTFQQYPDGSQVILPDQKALRLSFSLLDIGYFHHRKSPAIYRTSTDSAISSSPDQIPLTSQIFTGSPGQFHFLIDQFGEMEKPFRSATYDSTPFIQLLPGTVQGGMALIYKDLTVTADIHASLGKNVFHGSNLGLHSGIEYYPLSGWPLRAGINIRNNKRSLLSLGTGIETKTWSFNAGIQLSSVSKNKVFNLFGAGVASLTLNL